MSLLEKQDLILYPKTTLQLFNVRKFRITLQKGIGSLEEALRIHCLQRYDLEASLLRLSILTRVWTLSSTLTTPALKEL